MPLLRCEKKCVREYSIVGCLLFALRDFIHYSSCLTGMLKPYVKVCKHAHRGII